jgi:sugar phosphate isomerase/epimerase
MKSILSLAAVALAVAGLTTSCKTGSDTSSAADKLGWQLAVHSYSFRKFSIFDAIDQTAAMGVKYMSISGHVMLDSTHGASTLDLSDQQMEAIKARMLADGIHWPFVNIGVVDLPPDEAKSRKVFEFAKKWDIHVLVAEPTPAALDTVDKLCREYNIQVAIHDHARPNHYWSPDVVLAAIKGRTPLMGDCADIGHWMESGLDPLDCLKKLDGHIICLHFKDNNVMGLKGHNVPWGTGAGNPKAWMEELKRQHFHGAFCIEYEYDPNNPGPEMAQCVKFFNDTCATLATSP